MGSAQLWNIFCRREPIPVVQVTRGGYVITCNDGLATMTLVDGGPPRDPGFVMDPNGNPLLGAGGNAGDLPFTRDNYPVGANDRSELSHSP